MGRIVIADTGYQTVSAAQDLVELLLASSQAAIIHSVRIMQSSDESSAEAELLQINLKRASGSYTSGSGGGSLTMALNNLADSAHGLSGTERNNTTQAVVGTGALSTIMSGCFNVIAGEWEYTPTPELRPPIGPSQAFIVSLDEAPADALTLKCVVVFELIAG